MFQDFEAADRWEIGQKLLIRDLSSFLGIRMMQWVNQSFGNVSREKVKEQGWVSGS